MNEPRYLAVEIPSALAGMRDGRFTLAIGTLFISLTEEERANAVEVWEMLKRGIDPTTLLPFADAKS